MESHVGRLPSLPSKEEFKAIAFIVNHLPLKCCLAGVFYLAAIPLAHSASVSQPLPSATNVLNRVIERASQVARSGKDETYSYGKRSLVQELNSHGEVIQSTEKKYKVLLIRGWPFSRLVEIQGQQLSETEMRKEDQKEEEFRKKIAGNDFEKMREKKEAWIKPELLARFNFNVISNAVYANRETVVLEFKPKTGNPEKTLQDRIYNRITGVLWIDEQDAEIARLEAHVTEEFSLGWLGMLGSLKTCNLTLERQKMPEGIWVNARQILLLAGRKILSAMRYRATEESSGFHHEP